MIVVSPYVAYFMCGIPLIAVVVVLVLMWRQFRRDRPFPPGACLRCGQRLAPNSLHLCLHCGWERMCIRCGYNLRANTSEVCPECGTSVPDLVD